MKNYIYLALFLLTLCVPAIAGTINSYTLKSPPDDADMIPIYDSDDGSTKKVQVGDISGSDTGISWSSYTDLTSLDNANEFIVNNSGVSKSINWEIVKPEIVSDINWLSITSNIETSGTVTANSFSGDGSALTGINNGWTSSGSDVYSTNTSDNFGIGLNSPTGKLTIKGNDTNTSNHSFEIFDSSNQPLFVVQNNDTSESQGRVGIGTSNPGSAISLDVFGNLRINGSTLPALTFGSDFKAFIVPSAQTSPNINFWTNSLNRMSIENSGNVTINDSSANGLVPLRVEGDTDQNLLYLDGTNNRFGIGTSSPQAKLSIHGNGTTTGSALRILDSSGNLKLTVLDGGNVGIGTATPGAKLDMFDGSIRAIGIGTTVPQQLCRKSDGTFGYFDGAWSGTCN